MSISVGDVLLKMGVDKGNFESTLTNMEKLTSNSAQKMQNSLRMIGGAFTAIGGTGLAMVESSKALNAELNATAKNLNITAGEMKTLALETTDVSFPLKEVSATFDELVKAGVKTPEALQANAQAFDALAEATGNQTAQLTAMLIPAYKAFGEQLPQTTSQVDKFTWLTKNTTVTIDDFASAMTYVAAQGKQLNLTSEDMIATLAVLESRGITGAAATRVFRTAITQAVTDGKTLNEVLNISQSEIESYKEKINNATGITAEYNKIAQSQYSIMDKLKQLWSETALRLNSFLQPLEPVLAGLTALGPAMIFLSTATGTAAVKTIAHTVALTGQSLQLIASETAAYGLTGAMAALNVAMYANPAGMIALGLTALAAGFAGLTIWQNRSKSSQDTLNKSTKNYEPPVDTAIAKTEAWKNALIELNRVQGKAASSEKQLDEIRESIYSRFKIYIDGLTDEVLARNASIKSTVAYSTAVKDANKNNREYIDSLQKKTRLTQYDINYLEAYFYTLNKTNQAEKVRSTALQATVDWQSKIQGLATDQQSAATKAGQLSLALDDVAGYMIATGRAAELAAIPVEKLADVTQNAQSLSEYFSLDPSVIYQWKLQTEATKTATQQAEEAFTKQKEDAAAVAQAIKELHDNVRDLGDAYAYSETTAGKLGITTDVMTSYLLAHGRTVDDIIAIYDQWGTDANVVTEKVGVALDDIAQWSETTREKLISDAEEATSKAEQSVQDAVDAEKEAIDEALEAEEKAHQTRLDNIQEEYDAEIEAIDDTLAAQKKKYNAEIKAVDDQLDALDEARQAREDAETKASLESEIAAETDSETKADLNKQLDELILESGNETWQEERKLALQKQLEEAVYAADKVAAQQELNDYLYELEYQRQVSELEAQKLTLEGEITAAEEAAKAKQDAAKDTYDYETKLENQKWENFQATKQAEKDALDTALKEALARYDADLAQFKSMCADKLTETDEMVIEYNKMVDKMNRDVTITIHKVIKTSSSSDDSDSSSSSSSSSFSGADKGLYGMASGGLVKAKPGGQIIRVAEGGEDEVITPISKLKQLFTNLMSGFQIPDNLTAAPLIANAGALGESINNYYSKSGDTYINFSFDNTVIREEADIDKLMEKAVSKMRLKGVRV